MDLQAREWVVNLNVYCSLKWKFFSWYRYLSLTDNWFVFTECMYNGYNSLKARVGTHCRLCVSTLFHTEGDKRVVLCYHLVPNTTKYMIKKAAWGTVTKPWAFQPIFHGPGHIRPDSFLKPKISLAKHFWGKIVFLEKCFLYMFCFRCSPLQWCLLTYYRKSTKISRIQVAWDLGHGNPATLGRNKRTCRVTAFLV